MADLYAIALDEKSETTFRSILLRQNREDVSLYNYENRSLNDSDEYLSRAIISFAILVIILVIRIGKNKKDGKAKNVKSILKVICNVFAIYALISLYLSELFYNVFYNASEIVIVFIEFIIAIAIYVLVLYKEKDLIFNIVKDFAIIPIIFTVIISFIANWLYDNTSIVNIETIYIAIAGFLILFYLLLIVAKRKEQLNKTSQIVKSVLDSILKGTLFWIAVFLVSQLLGIFGLLVVLACYVLFRKLVLKENNIEMKEGKITFNFSFNDLIAFIVVVIALIILVIFASYMYDDYTYYYYYEYTPMEYFENLNIFDIFDNYSINDTAMAENVSPGYVWEYATDSTGNSGGVSRFSDTMESSMSGSFKSSGETSFESMKDTNSMEQNNEELVSTEINVEENLEKQFEIEQNVRNVFLESLAFVPELITENGNAKYETTISDNITTWNIQAVGNTKNGEVGYNTKSFKVFKPIFVDFSLPTNSVVTDKTSIPVTVYNYTEGALSCEINVKENDWSKIENYTKNITVNPNSTQMVYVPLEIIKAGNNTLRIETKAGDVTDIVEKTMNVNINGLEKEEVISSGKIDDKYTQNLIFNDEAIDGTKKIKVKVYPSVITEIIENVDSILKMPSGCFEQVSSSLYPDILVLNYLEKNNLDNPELREKALNYISTGYQKLLTYEVEGEKGGYSLYGKYPAEPSLTAYGLMEMNELSKVYNVDEKVIDNMIEFLFSKQKTSGDFRTSETRYISGMTNLDELTKDAYIVWALSEVCPEDTRLLKSIDYLRSNIDEHTDNYCLALIANIFANLDMKDEAIDFIENILDEKEESELKYYISSNTSDYYGTTGFYQNIQTTALTSLALTKLDKEKKINDSLISYIIAYKDHRGTWGTTQSTVLALKAINAYEKNSKIENQNITISLNGNEKIIEVGEDSLDLYEITFDNPTNENKITIDPENEKINYEIIKEYYQEYSKVASTDNKISVTQEINQNAKVNDVISQKITVSKNSDVNIENGLLQINIPQGCSVVEDSLLQLQTQGVIEKYEYNYEKINIYIRGYLKENTISLNVNYKALYPENVTGGAIRFYDYYNPSIEGFSSPNVINIAE